MKHAFFLRPRAIVLFSQPFKRFLRAMAFAGLFCISATQSLQAATAVYFTDASNNGAWAVDEGGWNTSAAGTGNTGTGEWTNGNYAYFFSTAISPANPDNITVGSAGVSTARITDVNSPGDLSFNSSTITLVGGANLTGYCLVRNETGNEMIFNSVIAGSSVGLYTGFSGGTIILGGANTYTGGTLAGAGTLVIQNGTSATGTGNVVVTNDPNNSTALVGTLSWNTTTAKITGSVTVASSDSSLTAKLGPSSGVSALHIGGGLTFGANSQPVFVLSSTYNGANDQVAVTGTLTCGSVQVGISCGSTLDTSGNDYVLFTSGGVSGSFNSAPSWTGTTPAYSSQYTIIKSGNNVQLHFTPIALTVTAAANTKNYDGTTNAAATPTYTGTLASGDSFSPTETYSSKNEGTGLTLTPAGTVSGGHGYYTYTYDTASTGVINKTNLTVTAAANSKTYDGTTSAAATPTVTAGSIQTGDTAPTWTETYSAKNVGTGLTLTPAGTVNDGNSGLNYNYIYATVTTGAITAKALTMSGLSVPSSKVYDGTTTATVTGSPGTLTGSEAAGSGNASDGKWYAGDSVSLTGTATGTYNSPNVGTASSVTFGGLSLGGTQASDYSLTIQSAASATITAASSANVVSSSTNPASSGASVTFTATLNTLASTAVPYGTVQFQIDGSPFGSPVTLTNSGTNGVAVSGSTSTLSRGYHTNAADYAGNGNIVGSTNTVVQLIDTPPVAGLATYSRTQNLGLIIAITNLLTNVTNVYGDVFFSLAAVGATSTNGATVFTNGNYVFYSPPGSNGNVTDTFSYTVADIYGITSAGTVMVTIQSPYDGPSVNITGITTNGNGTVTINFAGIPNLNYLIQAATNLTSPITWTTLSTNTAGTNGLFQYTDLNATNYSTRYYRTAIPQD